jgi:hypothetical protein
MQRGIEHTFSVAHELVHNGAIERTIKTVNQMARRSLAAAALPARLWPFAVRHCVHLLNRIPHAALDHRFSPYAALYHTHPRMHHLLPFDVLLYFKVLPPPSKVLAKHASLGVFLGFHPNVDALFVWAGILSKTARSSPLVSVSWRGELLRIFLRPSRERAYYRMMLRHH